MGLKKGTLENLLINSSKTTADKDLQTGDSAHANRLLMLFLLLFCTVWLNKVGHGHGKL